MAGIAILAGAGLSAAGGGVLFGLAESNVSQVRASPNDPSLRNSAVGMARGADAAFGVAIIAAGVAVFLLASGGSGS